MHSNIVLPLDVRMWDNDDVCEWLEELDLEQYCESFRCHDISGLQLLKLKKSDLQVGESCKFDSLHSLLVCVCPYMQSWYVEMITESFLSIYHTLFICFVLFFLLIYLHITLIN